jgi:hypothetical protein
MKTPECDREAARLLAIQMGGGKGAKSLDRAFVILFAALILALSVLFWAIPDRTFSETENKDLTQLPAFTVERLIDGRYTADIADYMADQFPGRDFFIRVKAAAEMFLGKMSNNGVILGEGGTLIPRSESVNTDNLMKNLSAIAAFTEWCENRGIPTTTAVAGRSMDVLHHTLPDFYGSTFSDALWAAMDSAAADADLKILPLQTPLHERAKAGEYVYYRTDHHWTTLGAYYGSEILLAEMGEAIAPMESYTREVVSDAFFGTTWSTAGMSWIAPDTMEYFRYAGDTDFTTTILDNGTSFAGFYDTSYLTKKDKYSSFIGGNNALVTVTKNGGEDRPTLLLVKDSFAHSTVPFLAQHYDLVIVDIRYYKKSTAALIDEYGADRVLVLYNIDSLTSSPDSVLLRAGLE